MYKKESYCCRAICLCCCRCYEKKQVRWCPLKVEICICPFATDTNNKWARLAGLGRKLIPTHGEWQANARARHVYLKIFFWSPAKKYASTAVSSFCCWPCVTGTSTLPARSNSVSYERAGTKERERRVETTNKRYTPSTKNKKLGRRVGGDAR